MSNIANLVAEIKAADAMSDAQLLELRRATGADMEIDAAEADILFEIDQISSKPEGWAELFRHGPYDLPRPSRPTSRICK